MAIDWSQFAVDKKEQAIDWSQFAVPKVQKSSIQTQIPAQFQQEEQPNQSALESAYRVLTKPRFDLGAPGAAAYGLMEGIGGRAHGIMQPVLESGLLGDRVKEVSKNVAQQRLQKFRQAQKEHPISSNVGNIVGDVASSMPAFLATSGLGVLGGSTAGGALTGATSYKYPEESRLQNALVGAGLGLATPLALSGIKNAVKYSAGPAVKTAKKLLGNKKSIAEDVFEGLPKNELAQMLESSQAGKKLGLKLTPAEASGNPLIGEFEGKLGVTPESKKSLYEFKKGQKSSQKEAVEKFLKEISPTDKVANMETREVAKSIISKKKAALREKASPYYEKSYSHQLPEEELKKILKDSNLSQAYKEVLSNPLYKTELEGFSKNSVKVLDQVKKNLDGKINNLYKNGFDEKARIMDNARKKLINSLDEVSPEYNKARKIYSEELPSIKSIENSKIGKIANLSDDQTKNISKTIFDANETDMKTFLKLRNDMLSESPETWKNIVKNEMERRLSSSKSLSSTGNYGSEFYGNILAREKDFRKFYSALGNPKSKTPTVEQQKLADMRKAFKGLINSRTVKTTAGQSETKMNMPRSTAGAIAEFYNKFAKGKYDKAAIKIITDDNWKKYLPNEISESIKGNVPKNPKQLMQALIALEVTQATAPEDGDGENE